VLFCWNLLQSELLSPLPFMLKSLKIENFRGFEEFELKQLGRINLLVGENNSGKTSILEAIRLLFSTADLTPLKEQLLYRGETSPRHTSDAEDELEISHLFYGHELNLGSYLRISALDDGELSHKFSVLIPTLPDFKNIGGGDIYGRLKSDAGKSDFKPSVVRQYEDSNSSAELQNRDKVLFFWTPPTKIDNISQNNFVAEGAEFLTIGILPKRGILKDQFRAYRLFDNAHDTKVQWVSSNALSTRSMIEIFNQIVLTPEENLANEALQIIDPTIRRIAPSGSYVGDSGNAHGGFLILKDGLSQRVPIGSMGDGMWRCLGLALAISNAKDGILLVDEIDIGLHFSAMLGMWKMILKTAERLNVQVFATTHSRDCWESLAEVAELEGIQGDEVMIHRIERGRKSSVTFNSPQMVIASEHSIEVR
jgi:predicted ATPase